MPQNYLCPPLRRLIVLESYHGYEKLLAKTANTIGNFLFALVGAFSKKNILIENFVEKKFLFEKKLIFLETLSRAKISKISHFWRKCPLRSIIITFVIVDEYKMGLQKIKQSVFPVRLHSITFSKINGII